MRSHYRILIISVVLLLATGSVQAQFMSMDVLGFLYETDNTPGVQGFPPSNYGDVLAGLGFIDGFSMPMFFNPADYEYTWQIQGLVSQGEIDLGNGQIRMYYNGGTVDIFIDEFMGPGYTYPMYGIDPPDPAVISDFTDGTLYLHGTFTSFVLTYDTVNHFGNYQGLITFELGPDVINPGEYLANPDGMTLAGTIGLALDPTIPDGYDMETDGHMYFDPTIPNEDQTWGHIKNLYR